MGNKILPMLYANRVVDKSYSLLKQNWSAPTVMTVIICFFMLLIHSFETIGIFNGNRNIEIRIQSPENLIKTYNMQSNAPKIEYNEMIVSEKLQNFSEKNREENLEKIRFMMMDSAMEQVNMEDINNSFANGINNQEEEAAEFFDL